MNQERESTLIQDAPGSNDDTWMSEDQRSENSFFPQISQIFADYGNGARETQSAKISTICGSLLLFCPTSRKLPFVFFVCFVVYFLWTKDWLSRAVRKVRILWNL